MRTHSGLLAATFVAIAPLAAQRVAEAEPNNSVAQAQSIAAGQQVVANLSAGDQDWYTFTLAAPGQIHLRTSGNFAVNPSVDTVVFLFDAAGTTRLAWNDNQLGVHSDCGATLPAGTYTCQVVGKLATTAGDYGLDFVVLPPSGITATEGPEPNGDPLLGGIPTPITLGDIVAGDLASPTDSDWYTFTLAGRGVVQAICYDDGGVPQLDNTRLALFQETSPGMWSAFGTASSLTTSHRSFNLGHPATLAAGNYAIEVSAGTAAAGTAPFHYTKTGSYAIRTLLVDMPGAFVVNEAPEPNNMPGAGAFMALGDSGIGNISGQNEGDWYAFGVNGPTTIAAMSDNWGSTPITDTTLRLLDSDGNLLTSASSGGPAGTSHGKLVFTVPQAGLYYIEVAGGLFAASGDYILYTGGASPLFVSAGWRAEPPSTNACVGSNGLRPALVVASGEAPQVGSLFLVRLQNALPNAVVLPFFGLSRTLANNGTVPLPFDMGQLGAPTCFLRVDPLVTLLGITDAGGVALIDAPVPTLLSLRGLPMFMQTVLLDLPNNSLGISMSNDARILVGERGY